MNYILTENGELYHWGVKGMKWGVRRYQNKDGSLTPAGKKRIAREYERTSNKVVRDLQKHGTKMYVDAYNKATTDMNRGGIEKFNKEQQKKYGDDYARRDGYMADYDRMFAKQVAKYADRSLNDFYKNNKNFQKCEQLIAKYDMTNWNELAMKNTAVINDLRRAIETGEHGD